jgi:DNA-binding NtrC family response regulator
MTMTNRRHVGSEEREGGVDLPPSRATGRRVIVVEDERRLREMLLASIDESGFSASGASSAEAAVRLLSQEQFAIALVDLNLPGMGGMDFCDILHQRWPNVQIIILTGFGDLAAARRAIRLDVVDFLTKPCGMDELEVALDRARQRWVERWLAGLTAANDAPPTHGSPRTAEPQPPVGGAAHRHADQQPGGAIHADEPTAPAVSMEEMERELIFAALVRHHGNREAAAAEIGISVRKLYYRLQQYQRQGFVPPK